MITAQFFREISRHRNLIEKNKNLFYLFCAAFEVTNQDNQVSPIQKEFLITELAFTYCHFGYSLFAESSMKLLIAGLSPQTGIDSQFCENYLLNLKKYLQDEIQFEKKEHYFSPESLEFSFAREFIKRIFSTDKEDDIQTGMFTYEEKFVDKIRLLSRKKIAEYSNFSKEKFCRNSFQEEKDNLNYQNLHEEFILFLNYMHKDPLTLIVSRFESFIHFLNKENQSVFIFRENNGFLEEKSKKITALLTMLVPHKHKSGQFLSKESTLSINKLCQFFSSKFHSSFFNLQPIRKWLNVENEIELKFLIENLMEESIKCGVVFKVPHGKESFVYGLNDNGLKIISPFREVLTESLVIMSQ